MVWPLIIAAASTVVSSMMSANAQKSAAAYAAMDDIRTAKMKQLQGEQIQEQAAKTAEATLQQARNVRSQQAALSASMGVVVGSGSAQIIQDDTERLAQADALATVYQGINGKIADDTEANSWLQKAKNALASGQSAADATTTGGIISAASQYAMGSMDKKKP